MKSRDVVQVLFLLYVSCCFCTRFYPGYLMSKSPHKVFVHYLPYYRTGKDELGWRGWNIFNHDPEKFTHSGKRDIAAAHYPYLDPYSSYDEDYIKQQVELMKLSGIDGVAIDVGMYWTSIAKSVRILADYLKKHNMQALLLFHDNERFFHNNQTAREDDVRNTYYDLYGWLNLISDVQIIVESRPVLGILSISDSHPIKGKTRLLPDELKAWINTYSPFDRPIVVGQLFDQTYESIMDGMLEWITPDTEYNGNFTFAQNKRLELVTNITDYMRNMSMTFHISTVWPGYDDSGVDGWNNGTKLLTREDGATYQCMWESVLNMSGPIVIIESWNNWWNGTQIEPDTEYGYKFLELTRNYTKRFKDIQNEDEEVEVKIPEYALKLKRENDEGKKQVGKVISDLIEKREYVAAEVEAIYFAEKVGLKDKEEYVSLGINKSEVGAVIGVALMVVVELIDVILFTLF